MKKVIFVIADIRSTYLLYIVKIIKYIFLIILSYSSSYSKTEPHRYHSSNNLDTYGYF